MRILLTGSTGFTGKYLVRMLEDSCHDILHLVRAKKGFKKEYIWDFVSPLPQQFPAYDILVHLAAHVNFDQNLEVIQYNVNTVSTIQLAAYAKTHNAYFIFASMTGIHGSRSTVVDQDTPIHPENHYGVSKYLAEEVIKTFAGNYSILRICGIYGLNGPQHLGLNKAITNAFHKKVRPILKGSGKARRNYICVNDVAQWILCLVNNYETTRTDMKEILYLAGPEVMTIEGYLETIIETLLPGMELERIAGPESQDLLVKSSPPPFPQLTFKQYLNSLIHL
jgi:nucleoside-diphosphate-sugar epimerase